jgi:hypothetical protein
LNANELLKLGLRRHGDEQALHLLRAAMTILPVTVRRQPDIETDTHTAHDCVPIWALYFVAA